MWLFCACQMIFQLFLNAFYGVLLVAIFVAASCAEAHAGKPAEGLEARAVTGSTRQGKTMLTDSEGNATPEYQFAEPAAVIELPDRLGQISGIEYLKDGLLAAVEDERGRVYLIDPNTGDVKEEDIEFGKKGDYEDVEAVGERIYVLRSDGALFRLEGGWRQGEPEVVEIETSLHALHGTCDAEGFAYDERNGWFIVDCKEDPGRDDGYERALYRFDPTSGTLHERPVFRIAFDEIEHAGGENLGGKAKEFKPSAVAVPPVTQEIYVLSSVLKAIVVVTSSGDLSRVLPLDEDRFPQPEGLAFLPGGDLLISSERAEGPATVLRFTYQR
jgi:hypothetical protein